MIDTILTLPLELMTLTLLVGFGTLYYSYHRRRPVTITESAPRPFDMRLDGQRPSL